jgi:hypothetical protein
MNGAFAVLAEALAPWRGFYTLLGSASATMIGLLFVAASVGGGIFSQDRRGALRMFLSGSVVHFSSILAVCLIVQTPVESWQLFALMIAACGTFGVTYSGLAWRDAVRDGLSTRIDLEDRTWYAVLPTIAYLLETGTAIALAMRLRLGLATLALSVGMLLASSIHNAWDITIWSITRRPN